MMRRLEPREARRGRSGDDPSPSPRRRWSRRAQIAGLLGTPATDILQPLRLRPFRWLWLSTVAWNFARWMELPITGWIALELTGSPAQVALLGGTRTAFLPLAGPISGALADRVDRVHLLKLAQWGNVLVIGAVAASLLAGTGAYWQLLLASLWLGASWGIDWPSRRALVADTVGPDHVLQAVVLESASQNASRIVGALLAGVLLAAWGGPAAYAVLALSFLMAAAALVRVTTPATDAAGTRGAGRRSVWRELAAGFAYVRRDPVIWAVLLIGVLMDALLLPYQQLLSVFADQVLAVGPVGLGYMGAATGAGAAAGLLVFPSLRRPRRQGWAYVGGSCLACAAVLLFAVSRWFPASLALLLLIGFGTAAFGTMQTTIILSRVSPAMRGRAMGLQALTIGSAPLGALEVSLLVERLGAPLAVGVNAAVCGALITLVALRSRFLHVAPAPSAAHPSIV
ncbi:MAG: MFS transporter [Chloroflexi bacterium]|nr:MFS transporter [Chloroflexota bacterium]